MPLGNSGDREMTALFAGQSAGMVRHRTATDLVQTLAEDALRRLRSFG
jgi:hypothetical protein